MAPLISLPRVNMRFRSSPNSLMAMFAFLYRIAWRLYWWLEIGWPISTFVPTMVPSFSRISLHTSCCARAVFNHNGASIQRRLPQSVFVQLCTSRFTGHGLYFWGMESSSSSARCPIFVAFFQEMPGSEEILMVNEPSLKGGRNERPRVKKQPSATTNSPIVPQFLLMPKKSVQNHTIASSCVLRQNRCFRCFVFSFSFPIDRSKVPALRSVPQQLKPPMPQ